MPGGRLDNPEFVSEPTLACYLPFGEGIFTIYYPGSSRLCILRFRAFSLSIFLCHAKKLLVDMSSCDSSGEDYTGRRLRRVQQDINQGKVTGWATNEEIVARQEEMERFMRKEVKMVTTQQEGDPSSRGSSSNNPILVGFINPQHDLSLNLSETVPPPGALPVSSTISEAYRITNQLCEDFCVLKVEVAVLEAGNKTLWRIIADLKNNK